MINSPIEEIKNRLDIVEVISDYIKLKKAGANYKAVCPFHSEKNPSLFVSPSRQIWRCFGCGTGGDIFAFIKQIEGVEFGDALRMLAKRAGVTLTRQDPQAQTERKRLYEICELACRFFQKQLNSEAGPASTRRQGEAGKIAKDYILQRGLNEDSIKTYRLGYAPDIWRGLSGFLVSKGYSPKEIINTGLAIQSQRDFQPSTSNSQPSYYDRFRGRVMFPVFDTNSQVVGFGGRILPQKKEKLGNDTPKYMNTPNTLLYDKSRILYNLNYAKVPVRKQDFCILVEGYFDVILSSQAGLKNIIATSGTALTNHHLELLKRYSKNLLTAFDMDIAGNLATKRGTDLAQAQGFNIKVITMPKGNDPADVISTDPEQWQALVKSAKSILEFYFESALSHFDKDVIEGKKEISRALLPVIKRIPDKIEQSFWVEKLSKVLQIKEGAILEELKKIKLESPVVSPDFIEKQETSRKELLQERICTLALMDNENLNLISTEDLSLFSDNFSGLISFLKENPGGQPENQELKELMDLFYMKGEVEGKMKDFEELTKCLLEFRDLSTKERLDDISREIKLAESEKNFSRVKELIQEFNVLAKTLNS